MALHSFSRDIDTLWSELDVDKNNWLDRNEAKNFLEAISQCIQDDMKQHYSPERIELLFDEFDTDKNGYFSKSEMAVLIKKTFSPSKEPYSSKYLTFDQKELLCNKQKTLDLNKSTYKLRIWFAIILGIVFMQTFSESSISN